MAAATVALAADVRPPADPGGGADQPATPSTFVPDSSVALERLALAEKLERASEWIKAAEVYQELLESYRDRVVPSGPDDSTLYVNVADRVLGQLSRWPAEGLAVYNGRYEPAAETLLAQAEDANALRAITDRYLLTRAGMTAAGRLMQHWWDQGQPGTSARFAERLASLLPEDHPQRAMLLFQSGLCWHLAGNTDRARTLAEQLKKDHAQAVGSVAGQETVLSTALATALDSAPAVAGLPTPGRVSADRPSGPARPRGLAGPMRCSSRWTSSPRRARTSSMGASCPSRRGTI